MKNKLVFALILLSITFSGCVVSVGNGGIRGNKKMVEKILPIADYNQIVMHTIGDIVYEQKPDVEPYFRLVVDENLVQYYMIGVNNDVLSIDVSENITTRKCKIFTNSKQLVAVDHKGIGKVDLLGSIEGLDLRINFEGVGNIQGGGLQYENIILTSTGVGDINLSGKVLSLETNNNGVGDVDTRKLYTENLKCHNSGVGSVKVRASKSANLNLSGVGSIQLVGNPTHKSIQKTGLGSIKMRKN